jgi:glycosyltransferase involved in cell wall biosynthesis
VKNTPEVVLILPCHNEAKSIQPLADEISLKLEKFPRKLKLVLFFVDDHSSDNTWSIIKKLEDSKQSHPNKFLTIEIRGLQLENHYGKAQAQALGIRTVAEQCDHVILMDSDGQHDPENLSGLIENLLESNKTQIGSRTDYERNALETSFMKFFVLLNKVMGIKFSPEWSEYLGIPASRAAHISRLPQLGIIPITSLVMMTYPDTRIFMTSVRDRIDGTATSRWSLKSLIRKALMHLFCDPWTFFPRLLFLSTIPLFLFLFYAIWMGIEAIRLGNLTGISSVAIIIILIGSIHIVILNILMGFIFVFQKVTLNTRHNV